MTEKTEIELEHERIAEEKERAAKEQEAIEKEKAAGKRYDGGDIPKASKSSK